MGKQIVYENCRKRNRWENQRFIRRKFIVWPPTGSLSSPPSTVRGGVKSIGRDELIIIDIITSPINLGQFNNSTPAHSIEHAFEGLSESGGPCERK